MKTQKNRNLARRTLSESLEPRLLLSAVDAGGNPATFELLAKGAAYQEIWSPGQEVLVNNIDTTYQVNQVFNNTSDNFYALGLTSPLYGPALAIQGSNTQQDIFIDSDPRGIGYQQFTDNYHATDTALSTVHGWLAAQTQRPDITGHSLGGALTQWIASAYTAAGGLLDQIVPFNSPGIPASVTSTFKPANVNAMNLYEVNGDPLAQFGQSFIPGSLHLASFNVSNNIFDKHSLPLLNAQIGSDLQPANIQWNNSMSIATFSSPNYSPTDPQFKLWVLATTIALAQQKAPALLQILPLALAQRGSAEAIRQLVGTLIRLSPSTAPTTASILSAFNPLNKNLL